MVRQEARFHTAMLLSDHSNRLANIFDARFEHQNRERSSNRMEMLELNEWWANELRPMSAVMSRRTQTLRVDDGIETWLDEFRIKVLPFIIKNWK